MEVRSSSHSPPLSSAQPATLGGACSHSVSLVLISRLVVLVALPVQSVSQPSCLLRSLCFQFSLYFLSPPCFQAAVHVETTFFSRCAGLKFLYHGWFIIPAIQYVLASARKYATAGKEMSGGAVVVAWGVLAGVWILSRGVRWGGRQEWGTNPVPGFPWPSTASLGSWCSWFPARSASLHRLCPRDALAPYLLTGLLLLWQRLSSGSVWPHSLRSTLILVQQREGLEQTAARELQAVLPSEQGGEGSAGWERLAQGLQLVKAENQVETLDKGCDCVYRGRKWALVSFYPCFSQRSGSGTAGHKLQEAEKQSRPAAPR